MGGWITRPDLVIVFVDMLYDKKEDPVDRCRLSRSVICWKYL